MTAREAGRPDRVRGMAAARAIAVHAGMTYDVEVDSSASSARDCARLIAARVAPEDGTEQEARP